MASATGIIRKDAQALAPAGNLARAERHAKSQVIEQPFNQATAKERGNSTKANRAQEVEKGQPQEEETRPKSRRMAETEARPGKSQEAEVGVL